MSAMTVRQAMRGNEHFRSILSMPPNEMLARVPGAVSVIQRSRAIQVPQINHDPSRPTPWSLTTANVDDKNISSVALLLAGLPRVLVRGHLTNGEPGPEATPCFETYSLRVSGDGTTEEEEMSWRVGSQEWKAAVQWSSRDVPGDELGLTENVVTGRARYTGPGTTLEAHAVLVEGFDEYLVPRPHLTVIRHDRVVSEQWTAGFRGVSTREGEFCQSYALRFELVKGTVDADLARLLGISTGAPLKGDALLLGLREISGVADIHYEGEGVADSGTEDGGRQTRKSETDGVLSLGIRPIVAGGDLVFPKVFDKLLALNAAAVPQSAPA